VRHLTQRDQPRKSEARASPRAAATLAIGEDAVRCAWAEGSAMSPEEAAHYATREPAAGRTQIEL
jgi:hypothetical protein